MDKLIEVKNLKKYFPVASSGFFQNANYVKAVDDVTFDIYKGETLGIVGESGCGKSTMGRILVTLLDSTSGEIIFEGKEVNAIRKNNRKDMSKNIQIIFQDPYASLNPRMTIGDIIGEPMKINGIASDDELEKKLDILLNKLVLLLIIKTDIHMNLVVDKDKELVLLELLSVNPKLIVCDEACFCT